MKNRVMKVGLTLSFSLLSTSIAFAADELLKNGSFENYTINKDNGRWKLVTFDNWQGAGEVWNSAIGKPATQGEHKIELDVGKKTINSLSQTVTTVAGQQYRLSMDAYARRKNTSDVDVLVDGQVIASISPDRKWAQYDTYFIGTGTEQVVSLKERDNQNNGLGTIIDNVSLQQSNELIVNGSFEDFTVNVDHGRWKEVTFAAWEGNGEAWNNKLGKRSTNGGHKIELDAGRELNTLSQTVTTENRLQYALRLDAYARRANSSDVEIWVDDTKLETIKPSKEWQTYRFTFFGNGSAQKIQLKEIDTQNNGLGTVIDQVSLVSTDTYDNRPPTIAGTAKTTIAAYDAYRFAPTASDVDNDTLTFSINNKPAWASFDSATGILSGTPSPSDVGSHANIQISTQDAHITTALAPFSIDVTAAVNIAAAFGTATQGRQYGSEEASQAIDGDVNTYNHTQCNANDNWWQLALPNPTHIAQMTVQGRNSNTHRLQDAAVYISQTPYTGTLNDSDKVATLAGSATVQEMVLSPQKTGNYLIVKANGSNCLHLANVEVYGQVPAAPTFADHENDYLIQGNSAEGDIVTTIKATDLQGDTLSYTLVGDVPFSIDSNGNISVNGALEAGTYTVEVVVSDGDNRITSRVDIRVTSATAAMDAVASGDVSQVTEAELIQATINSIEATKSFLLTAKTRIFNLNADGTAKADGSSLTVIDWDPTHDAAVLSATLGKNTALLTTNAVTKAGYTVDNKTMAVIGAKGAARYMVMGSNPLRNTYRNANTANEQMHQVLENAMTWLTGRDNLQQAPFKVVLAHLDQSYYFPDEVASRQWLDSHYADQVSYNAENSCDGTALAACLDNSTDLLIISQIASNTDDAQAIAATVNQALQNGTSVLYLHHNGNLQTLGKTLFTSVFDVNYTGDNYWRRLSFAAYDPTANLQNLSTDLTAIKTLFTHFQQSDYNVDWSGCEQENCRAAAGLSDFSTGAALVKTMMNNLDQNKKRIFDETGYTLQKLLALTADKFRQGVRFPMDKNATDDTTFLKAYYADHAVYNYRERNAVQADMGNFSRSDFSHITPRTKTVDMTSKQSFRAAGVYALPGQTLYVTRNDNSNVETKVFINTLRSGSTHEFASNGYKRPKFLQSVAIEVKAGETIRLTSPYGGPVQIRFNANDLPVSFTFQNIGEHPYWNDADDNDLFAQQLDAGNYDWAELATPGFEVHSTLSNMRKSMNDSRWGNAQALAAGTMRYMHNLPHALAGLKGVGIDPIPELHDFANANNWEIQTLAKVQHMNADQATCGYGCSGNPYDAYWSFSPIGHGDVHELGHGLQGGRRFAGWENHSMTNYYSYYTKSNYFKDTGGEPECQSLPFEANFNVLQASINQADPAAYMQANLWDKNSWSKSAAMFIQMMMVVQSDGALSDGWLLRGRLHLFERALKQATVNDSTWLAKRDNLGMGSYSRAEAKAINNNDWYLVALSYSMQRDFRDYLTMWAIPFSEKAATQVAGLGYSALPRQYFASDAKAYCKGLDKPALAVDGQQAWSQ